MTEVAIVGTGTIGDMLIRARERFAPDGARGLRAANRSAAPLDRLRVDVPALRVGAIESIVADARVVIVCVASEACVPVAERIGPLMSETAVLVSVSNAVPLAELGRVVDRPVVKLVPSLAHAAGRGVALLAAGPRAGRVELDLVRAFAEPFARVVEIDDADSRIATNIAGCGPALLACFTQWLAESARGFASEPTAALLSTIAAETLAGTGALVADGWSTERIQHAVATPGGSTEAALRVLVERLPSVLDAMHRSTSAKWRTPVSDRPPP